MQNSTKKIDKQKNARIFMCANELKQIRYMMRYAPRDMYQEMRLPRRTYQDYESGKRRISQKVAAQIREMYRRDCEFMNGIANRVDAALMADYPDGIIPSIQVEKEEEL